MTKIEIDMDDFNAKFNVALRAIAMRMQMSMAAKLGSALEKGGPKMGRDTGHLKANIQWSVEGNEITFTLPQYALYLEFGTPGRLEAPPGMSPSPNRKYPMYKEGGEWHSYLEDWVARKMGTKDPGVNFMVARHIALYGTRPFPFIRTTFRQSLGGIVRKSFREAFA